VKEELGLLQEIQIVAGRTCERSQLLTTRRATPAASAGTAAAARVTRHAAASTRARITG
jgi:hypothetical protein